MAKTVTYDSTTNYNEFPLTGILRVWTPQQTQSVPDSIAALLLATGLFDDAYGRTPLYGDRVVTVADNDAIFDCTTALTITIPASLSPRPSFVVIPPASGNASIAVTGGAQINGATSTLTRSRASNAAGIAVVAYTDSDGYGVSGS